MTHYALLIKDGKDPKLPCGRDHTSSTDIIENSDGRIFTREGDKRLFTKDLEWIREQGYNVQQILEENQFILDYDKGTTDADFVKFIRSELVLPSLLLNPTRTIKTRGGWQSLFTTCEGFKPPRNMTFAWQDKGERMVEVLVHQTTAVVGNVFPDDRGDFTYHLVKDSHGNPMSSVRTINHWFPYLYNKACSISITKRDIKDEQYLSPFPLAPAPRVAKEVSEVHNLFTTSSLDRNNTVFKASRILMRLGLHENQIAEILVPLLLPHCDRDYTQIETTEAIKNSFRYNSEAPAAPKMEIYDGKSLLTMKPIKPVFWNIRPESFTMFVGETGIGKSQIVNFLAARLSQGFDPIRKLGNDKVQKITPQKVMVLTEGHPHDASSGLQFHNKFFKVHNFEGMSNLYYTKGHGRFNHGSFQKTLSVFRNLGIDVFILDGIQFMLHGDSMSESSGADYLLDCLNHLVSWGACVISMNHVTKTSHLKEFRNPRGSQTIMDFHHLVLQLAPKYDKNRKQSMIARYQKSRYTNTRTLLHIPQDTILLQDGESTMGVTDMYEESYERPQEKSSHTTEAKNLPSTT